MKRLLIIDGQNMFIRLCHVSPIDINGAPIGGVTGFMRSHRRKFAEPTLTVAIWEIQADHKRREKNKNYKVGRQLLATSTPCFSEEERENKYLMVKLTEY